MPQGSDWIVFAGVFAIVVMVVNWWDKLFDRHIWPRDEQDDDQPRPRRREADQQPEE